MGIVSNELSRTSISGQGGQGETSAFLKKFLTLKIIKIVTPEHTVPSCNIRRP